MALGQTNTSTTHHVEVTAARRRADPSQTVATVSEARLQRARLLGEDLGSVVDTLAGARVLDSGGALGERRLTVRGGSPGQGLVVLDGQPILLPFATGFDLALVPPEALGQVRLVRGGQGASLGEGALTGALELQTRQDVATFLGAGFGSLETVRLAAATATAGVMLAGIWEGSEGRFEYRSRLPGLPDALRVRNNNDGTRASLTLSARQSWGPRRLMFSSVLAHRQAGLPGLAASPGESLDAREARVVALVQARLEDRYFFGSAGLGLMRIEYQNRSDASDTLFVAPTAALGYRRMLAQHRLQVQAEGTVERSDSTIHGRPQRVRWGLVISDALVWGRWRGFGALRAQGVGSQQFLLPRLGARLDATENVSWSLGLGRSLRAPALDELYHPPVVGFEGNRGLLAETAWEAESQLRWHTFLGALSAGLFARRISDAILYLNRNAFVIRPENVGAAWALGTEIEASWHRARGDWGAWVIGTANFLYARLDLTGAPLPTQPTWGAAGEVGCRYQAWAAVSAMRGFGATHTTLRPTPQGQVPAYLRWDVSLLYQAATISVALRIQNLLDHRSLQTSHRLPLPGRTYFVQVGWGGT